MVLGQGHGQGPVVRGRGSRDRGRDFEIGAGESSQGGMGPQGQASQTMSH